MILNILIGWCLLSVPVAIVLGKFIAHGLSPATQALVSAGSPLRADDVSGPATALVLPVQRPAPAGEDRLLHSPEASAGAG